MATDKPCNTCKYACDYALRFIGLMNLNTPNMRSHPKTLNPNELFFLSHNSTNLSVCFVIRLCCSQNQSLTHTSKFLISSGFIRHLYRRYTVTPVLTLWAKSAKDARLPFGPSFSCKTRVSQDILRTKKMT